LLFTTGEIKTKVAGLKSVCKCGWRGMVGGGGFGGFVFVRCRLSKQKHYYYHLN